MIESIPTKRVLLNERVYCRYGVAPDDGGGWAPCKAPGYCRATPKLADAAAHMTNCPCRTYRDVPTPGLVVEGAGMVVSASVDKTMLVWRLSDGQRVRKIQSAMVLGVHPLPGVGRVCTAELDGIARVWDILRGRSEWWLKGHDDWVTAVARLPCGRLATASDDGTLRVWSYGGTEGPVYSNPQSRGGSYRLGTCEYILGGRDGDNGHEDRVLCVAPFGPDRLLSGSDDRTLKVWRLLGDRKFVVEHTYEGHDGSVKGVVDLGEDRILSVSADTTMRVWKDGQCLREVEAHANHIKGVCRVGPEHVVTASSDNTIKVWRLPDLEEVRTIVGHKDTVRTLAAIGDQRFVSSSADMTCRVWRLHDGVCERVLEGHTGYVGGVCYLPP